ncbi:hypothetical protein [Halalkalibacter sp. APA_J-10(15)]|uniref:hypothetical protein n=1 Tax=Halalkalibacter sp. APA_J-10(15) TaxID=2933805 RepID=UPI001FF564B8|nr:hypothetical protein [Halalkalibacter sp. APA_J-10(15)]MCK0470892.1 hypothetical protein [Halalkalibacter sp. APA_J-10(15)]
MSEKKESILFGSGDIYVLPESVDLDTSTDAEIEAAMIKIGESSGEAQLTHTQEWHEVKGGAQNNAIAAFVTSEDVIFNGGICTFDFKAINEITATYYSEDETKRTMGIGGKLNVPVKQMLFVHTKRTDGKKIKLKMYRAQNRSGMQLTFSPESESVFNFEIKLLADPTRENGNVVKIEEEL